MNKFQFAINFSITVILLFLADTSQTLSAEGCHAPPPQVATDVVQEQTRFVQDTLGHDRRSSVSRIEQRAHNLLADYQNSDKVAIAFMFMSVTCQLLIRGDMDANTRLKYLTALQDRLVPELPKPDITRSDIVEKPWCIPFELDTSVISETVQSAKYAILQFVQKRIAENGIVRLEWHVFEASIEGNALPAEYAIGFSERIAQSTAEFFQVLGIDAGNIMTTLSGRDGLIETIGYGLYCGVTIS